VLVVVTKYGTNIYYVILIMQFQLFYLFIIRGSDTNVTFLRPGGDIEGKYVGWFIDHDHLDRAYWYDERDRGDELMGNLF
jgi:hypothetical protein